MATQDLTIYFLNVGQGHCAFLKLPGGEGLLIDINHAKPSNGKGVHVLNFLRDQLKDTKGQFTCIIGHPDKDHCRGLKDIWEASDLHIERLFDSTLRKEKEKGQEYPEYDAYIDIVGKLRKDGKVVTVKRGTSYDSALKFDWGGIRFFTPEKDFSSEKLGGDDMNRKSVIIQLEYHGTRALFASDTSFLTYKEDLKSWGDLKFSMLKSQVLLVSHHGSRSFFRNSEEDESYTEALDSISPDYAIISVGKDNPHDHPHKDALDLYSKKTKKVYRTDQDGSVVVTFRKLPNGTVAVDVNPDSTIDQKYGWGDDDGGNGGSSEDKGPVITSSWKKSSPSVLGGNPKGSKG